MTRARIESVYVREIRKVIRRYKAVGEAKLRALVIKAAYLESRELGDAMSKQLRAPSGTSLRTCK